MSEAPKNVEEPVAAPATGTSVAEPVAESTPAVTEPATVAPADTEPATTTEAAAPVKEEIKPVEEGILGYKAPGLIKGFIFQKKFFWFGSEPVEVKSLSSYLRGEKPEAANHNAAWASHTGKGLLFFSKKATDKASPAGIINLSDVSDLTPEGTIAFHFTLGGHKHTFEATTLPERDNWVSVLKEKIAEAKELAPSVTEHETYKKSHGTLSKPVAAVTTPKKSTEVKKEEKAEAKEEKKIDKLEDKIEKKEEKAEKKEEKKERKSRSASRKRTSIFGAIPGFGKKEEKVEPKEEATAVSPATEAVAEPVTEPAPVEAPVVAEPTVTEPAAPAAEEPIVAAPIETKPAPTKRNSIFGTLKSSFSQHKEKKPETEAAPAVPAKDAEPVSETAPVIPAVESTEPLAATVASPATVPTETTAIANGETKAAETPAVKSDKRKSSLPWLTKKEKTTSDEEGEKEKPLSPFAKLRATVKGKSSPKAEKPAEKPVEPAAETSAEPAGEAPAAEVKPEEPVVSEPIPAAHTSTPQVSATA